MNTPSQLLIRLKTHLEIGERLPADVCDWLLYALNDFERSGNKKTLCASLGLRGSGKSSILTQLKIVRRNQHIYKAWQLISLDNNFDDWNRTKRLVQYIARFETTTWQRFVKHNTYPKGLNPVQNEIFMALNTGAYIPGSAKQIHRIAMDMKQGDLMSMSNEYS